MPRPRACSQGLYTLEDTVSVKKNDTFWHENCFWHVLTRFDTRNLCIAWVLHFFWHVLTRFDTFWHFLTRKPLCFWPFMFFDTFWHAGVAKHFLTRIFWHVLTRTCIPLANGSRCQTIVSKISFWTVVDSFLTRVDTKWHTYGAGGHFLVLDKFLTRS